MVNEAKVRVKLDTGEARRSIDSLTESAAGVAGKVATGVRSALGTGLAAAGLGGGFALASAAIRAPTQSGLGAAIGEAFSPMGAWLEQRLLGSLGQEAKAANSAREQVINTFGLVPWLNGKPPNGSVEMFNMLRAQRETQERGRHMFEMSEQFHGPNAEELVQRVLEGLKELLNDAAKSLAEFLWAKMWG